MWRAVEEGGCGMVMGQRVQEVDSRNLMKEECQGKWKPFKE